MKKRTAIIVAGALVCLGFAPLAAGAGEMSNDIALFGKDPGAGKAYACYTRAYDPVHLKAHPEQNVCDMLVFVHSSVDAESGRQYSVEIGAKFRALESRFQASGGCGLSEDGTPGLNCGIDCDGGTINVRVRDANSLLVSIPDGARTWSPDTDETPEAARFGEDDKLFRVDRTALSDCLPLVADDEIKADISAAK